MAPSKSALPGPMATIAPVRMRIFGTSARDMGLKKSKPFAQETESQYNSTLGDRRLPRQTVSRRSAARSHTFQDSPETPTHPRLQYSRQRPSAWAWPDAG